MTLIPTVEPKDPASVLPYNIEWATWLGAVSKIAVSEWSISGPDSELVIGEDAYAPIISADGQTATVWLIGGTAEKWYRVTNHIETDDVPPRITDRSFRVLVRDR